MDNCLRTSVRELFLVNGQLSSDLSTLRELFLVNGQLSSDLST